MKIDFSKIDGFEWDKGNTEKSKLKHRVECIECEEVFFNEDILLYPDESHSKTENRYYVLGITSVGRYLFISFTIRNNKIRVISARPMNRKEKNKYHEKTKKRHSKCSHCGFGWLGCRFGPRPSHLADHPRAQSVCLRWSAS